MKIKMYLVCALPLVLLLFNCSDSSETSNDDYNNTNKNNEITIGEESWEITENSENPVYGIDATDEEFKLTFIATDGDVKFVFSIDNQGIPDGNFSREFVGSDLSNLDDCIFPDNLLVEIDEGLTGIISISKSDDVWEIDLNMTDVDSNPVTLYYKGRIFKDINFG